jgi:hypothetical protein
MSSSDEGRADPTGALAPEPPPADADARPPWSHSDPPRPQAAAGGSLLRDTSAGSPLFGSRSLLRARGVVVEPA